LFDLARPNHPAAIEYIINTANILNNIDGNQDRCILYLIKTLGMDKEDLWKLIKRTATATARALLRYKYPNPAINFG
jgi:hypothetical protein